MTRPYRHPFDPAAPADSIDGRIPVDVANDPDWLPLFRQGAAAELRRRRPTGVATRPGMSIREATFEALVERNHGLNLPCPICKLTCPAIAALVDIDHVIPLSMGGRHHIDNLALTHRACNQFKRARTNVDPADARAALFAWIDRRGWTTGPLAQRLRAEATQLEEQA